MHDGAEQHRLIGKAMIERALGDAGAPRQRVDGRQAIALGEEQLGRDIQDALRDGRPPRRLMVAGRWWRDLTRVVVIA
jgi:hypothetical protein